MQLTLSRPVLLVSLPLSYLHLPLLDRAVYIHHLPHLLAALRIVGAINRTILIHLWVAVLAAPHELLQNQSSISVVGSQYPSTTSTSQTAQEHSQIWMC